VSIDAANTALGYAQIDCAGVYPIRINTNSVERMRVDSTGKILFNSAASTAAAAGAHLLQVWGGTTPLSLIRVANSSTPINLEFSKGRGTGTVLPGTTLVSGDSIGRLYFSGSDGTTSIPAAFVDVTVDGAVATNGMPGRLVFSTTASGSATPTERMRIDSNGNVYAASGTTDMTGGFIWAAAAAGTPTAAPTSAPTGRVPLYYDTTANKLYVYNGGWKASAAFA
jgi:hypothetical protein